MSTRWLAACAWLALLVCCLAPARPGVAAVLRVEIERRVPLLEGRPFGEHGAYELLEGRVHFGFDPESEANARVTDIGLAPRGDDGLVHAWSELVVLQPVDPARRRGTALVGIPNRGRRLALATLNRAGLDFQRSAGLDPDGPADWGDGFLMEQGLTLIWVGWQADAPAAPGSMRLRVPIPEGPDGTPVRGLARSDWVVDEPTDALALAALGHQPHRPADPGSPQNVLTRRQSREGQRVSVPREAWRFSEDGTRIVHVHGFEPGIYELVYVATGPPLVGLGFAAVRDIAAYAKHDLGAAFRVERSVALGSSQSGRFLRHFLYEGFNVDEAGRRVYDGIIVNIAGGGRGGFNHRFSHPGRVGNPFQNFFFPGDDPPFTSARPDAAGRQEGLLDRVVRSQSQPRLFQINTGYEYWGRVASLIHMTPDGRGDVIPMSHERIYHIASAPHFPGPFPPPAEAEVDPGIYRGSSIDTSYPIRALLLQMLGWVESGRLPPATRVPRIADQTLVHTDDLVYPMPFLRTPRTAHVAYRLDFGPRFVMGIVDHQPPRRDGTLPVRVPSLDEVGNERTGIRLPEVAVPIGTYTPWALRTGRAFATDEMAGYVGSFIPLSVDGEEKARRRDQRPTLRELYPERADYEEQVARALESLVREGWMLEQDRERAREAAMARWEWITSPSR